MLNFIYENQALSQSQFAYIWYQFKTTNDVNNTAEELKYIFNCQVLCNISDYDQLDINQQNYFEVVELLDIDETERILLNNEPQAGLDFRVNTENDDDSTDSELDDSKLELMIKDNLKNYKTYHGVFEEDTYDQLEECVLKIKKPTLNCILEEEEGDNEMQSELKIIFSALLTTNEERNDGIQKLSQEQIFNRLKGNRDLFANAPPYFYHLRNATGSQVPTPLDNISDYCSEASKNSMPEISANTTSSSDPEPLITQDLKSSTPYENQPSTSRAAHLYKPNLNEPSTSNYCQPSTSNYCQPSTSNYCQPSTSHNVTATIKPKLVPNPSHNPRMSKFIADFKSKKRPRRSTISPPKSQ